MDLEPGGESHGKQFVTKLHECLWYIDRHHQMLADRSHPIPSIFKNFSGYNTPEVSKHRKRVHTNMSADELKKHANDLKKFLLRGSEYCALLVILVVCFVCLFCGFSTSFNGI